MCSYNLFMYLSLIFITIGIFLGLISLNAGWVTWEDEKQEYEGTLFTVDDYANIENADWSWLAGTYCDADFQDHH